MQNFQEIFPVYLGYTVEGANFDIPESPCEEMRALLDLCSEFNGRWSDASNEIASLITEKPTLEFLEGKLRAVTLNLFSGGVSWGKILAFFVFMQHLMAHLIKNEERALFLFSYRWALGYGNASIEPWVAARTGAWNRLLKFQKSKGRLCQII